MSSVESEICSETGNQQWIFLCWGEQSCDLHMDGITNVP